LHYLHRYRESAVFGSAWCSEFTYCFNNIDHRSDETLWDIVKGDIESFGFLQWVQGLEQVKIENWEVVCN